MSKIPSNPAQRQLVHQFINWDLIVHRREQYPAIGRAFSLSTLKEGIERPPYCCHYMAWRLGTWATDLPFQRLEELLRCAEKLPNWKHEQSLLSQYDFADFWSLVWQLQVAEYLCDVGSEVSWNNGGPDLSASVNGRRWYVECYVPRKSFGMLNFLADLLEQLDASIQVRYDLCMPFQLPLDLSRSDFIDAILSTFLNPANLEKAKNEASKEWPVLIYKHSGSSLQIYVEGDDLDVYRPGIVSNQTGSRANYFEVVLREVLKAKQGKNQLAQHRPNLVAVNFLLSTDFQFAINSIPPDSWPIGIDVGTDIDAMAISVLGIDQQLTKSSLKFLYMSDAVRDLASEFTDIAKHRE